MLDELLAMELPIVVFETDSAQGGLSTTIAAYIGQKNPTFSKLSLRDGFVNQGSIFELRQEQHITLHDLFQTLDQTSTRDKASDQANSTFQKNKEVFDAS